MTRTRPLNDHGNHAVSENEWFQPVGVSTSISQVSLAPPSSKRPRPTTTTEAPIKIEPDYLKVPDYAFKKILSAALEGGEIVVQSLDALDKLQYARVYAQRLNDVCFHKLKQDYYEQYYQVVYNAGVWSSVLSKEEIKKNHLHRIEFITQEKIWSDVVSRSPKHWNWQKKH